MKPRVVYLFLGTFLITCIVAVNTQDSSFLPIGATRPSTDTTGAQTNEQILYEDDFRENQLWRSTFKPEWSEWRIFEEKQTTERNQDDTQTLQWNQTNVHVGKKCSRYCIRKATAQDHGDEKVPRINLFLSFVDNNTGAENRSTEDRLGHEGQLEITENRQEVKQSCVIDLDVNCEDENEEIPGQYTQTSKNNCNYEVLETAETLVENTNSSEYTEVSFHVDDWMSRINIYIQGNLLHAVLEVPSRDETILGTDFKISLTGSNESRCLVIESNNPPPGRWCLKLTAQEDRSYRFAVMASILDDEEPQEDNDAPDVDLIHAESIVTETTVGSREKFETIAHEENEEISTFDNMETLDLESPQEPYKLTSSVDRKANEKTKDNFEKLVLLPNLTPMKNVRIARDFELHSSEEGEDGDYSVFTSKQNHTKVEEKLMSISEVDIGNFSADAIELQSNAKLAELENFDRISTGENTIRMKKINVDVSPLSKLIITPETTTNQNIHRVLFDVKNNYAETVRCEIRATSTPFRVFNVYPQEVWLIPRQTTSVAVDVEVPRTVIQENINTVTLFVKSSEIVEKSAYIYIQTSDSKIITDGTKPVIEYTFNSNCNGKLKKDECAKYLWSADIKISDPDSGLKYVSASPNNLYEQTEFISGTKKRVNFYYSADCCSTTAKITAIDLLNNENTQTIDVTAWDNLSEAEVAVIVVGVLFIILLIALIIMIIMYCVRRKKSHDLPYTQRYGSRPTARTEGTNF